LQSPVREICPSILYILSFLNLLHVLDQAQLRFAYLSMSFLNSVIGEAHGELAVLPIALNADDGTCPVGGMAYTLADERIVAPVERPRRGCALERALLGASFEPREGAAATRIRRENSSSEKEYSGSGSVRRVSRRSAGKPSAVSISSLEFLEKREGMSR